MVGDRLVHLWLGERGFITLVVTETAIAPNVDHDILAEFMAEFGGDARHVDHGFNIVAVHVKNWCLRHLGDFARIPGRSRCCGVCREADLVVHNHMDGTSGTVPLDIGETERFGHDALAAECSVPMHQETQNLVINQ